MTYREHFMRLHPNARLLISGLPEVDPCDLYGTKNELCKECNKYTFYGDYEDVPNVEKCKAYWNAEMPPMTNGDKLRSMTDVQLAKALNGVAGCIDCPCYISCSEDNESCANHLLKWLKQEVTK